MRNEFLEELLEKANEGDTEAQTELGFRMIALEEDCVEGAKWLELAAEKDAAAESLLGECYFYGCGIQQDCAKAVKLLASAAEKGIAQAQYALGLCYDIGQGCEQNKDKAFKWYMRAAVQDHIGALYEIGMWYYNSTADFARDEARKWLRKAAQHGHVKAQFFYGESLLYGSFDTNSNKDIEEGYNYLHSAAWNGLAKAQIMLAKQYRDGNAVIPKDIEQAKFWYKKAADQGDCDAITELRKLQNT